MKMSMTSPIEKPNQLLPSLYFNKFRSETNIVDLNWSSIDFFDRNRFHFRMTVAALSNNILSHLFGYPETVVTCIDYLNPLSE